MKKLGISIYPEKARIDKTIKYIDLAKKYGFSRIFTNLLEIEDTKEGNKQLSTFKQIYMYAKKKGFEVIVDVNPEFYKNFKIPNDDIQFFLDMGATGLRLDEDFKGVIESKLSQNKQDFKIELNASNGTETFDLAIKHKAQTKNLIACHNFYPMRFTGLDYDRFVALSAMYKAKGIRVAAFVTLPEKQKGIGPWNVNEGMPTIEKHRDMNLIDQIRDLLVLDVIDDIIISQQGASEKQFKEVKKLFDLYKEIDKLKNVDIPVILNPKATKTEKDIMFVNKGKMHLNRPDFNSYFLRSTYSRIDYAKSKIAPNNAGKKLKLGDVVIINENLGRYKGELHIILNSIDDSKQKARNLVGVVGKEDIEKLCFMKRKQAFKLIRK